MIPAGRIAKGYREFPNGMHCSSSVSEAVEVECLMMNRSTEAPAGYFGTAVKSPSLTDGDVLRWGSDGVLEVSQAWSKGVPKEQLHFELSQASLAG